MAEFLRSIQDSDGPADAAEPEVRLAVYDSPLAAPRVVSLRGREFHEFVGDLAARTYNFGRERGGRIPYIVIREIIENLIHAYFQGAVISILDDGNTIRISDQGPGVPDKEKALQQAAQAVKDYETDAVSKPGAEIVLAQIQARFGQTDAVITALPHLLQVPAGLTVANLKLDPMWDPIRKDPRFQKLCGEKSK